MAYPTIKSLIALCLHTRLKCVVSLLLAQVNFSYIPLHVLSLHIFNLVSWSYDSLSNIWLYHTERGVLVTVCNPSLKYYEEKNVWTHAVTISSLLLSFFFFFLSWHLWAGFLWPRFSVGVVLPVPRRQPTTNMHWQFKLVQFTGSSCDSGHWAPGRKDAYATRQAMQWQKAPEITKCRIWGCFMSVSPGIWPSLSSALLFRKTWTGTVPGPFASQREIAW